MAESEGSAPPGAVDIGTLTVPQLRSLQSRLNSELEHLTNSHSKLRAAQSRFKDCVSSINIGVKKEGSGSGQKDEILVPLTSSLYVKGKLADREKVIVDVGTGFYVEKTAPKAIEFYNNKVEELGSNLRELEKVVQAKSTNLKVIEDVLRQKVMSGEAVTTPAGGGE
ncbi:subunit of tubulin prefoldin [Arachnomyces sp. PD_36]|nr:subunit of tubulin prefoldin [Arachnomyces sp. PD_36]